jgi:hypothetical protein
MNERRNRNDETKKKEIEMNEETGEEVDEELSMSECRN